MSPVSQEPQIPDPQELDPRGLGPDEPTQDEPTQPEAQKRAVADLEDPERAALVAALVELERHVADAGWDQPPRLFALVLTDELILAEPELAGHLGLQSTEQGGQPGALTGIEQDPLDPGVDLIETLSTIEWPSTVHGCAVSLERTFLPTTAPAEIPEEAEAAAQYVNEHPDREDIRVLVGAVRGARRFVLTHGVARMVSQPEELLGGETLVPDLGEVVARTLMTNLSS